MKVNVLKGSLKKVTKAQKTSRITSGVRRNSHSVRLALEHKGFAALNSGTYVHDKIDMDACSFAIEQKSARFNRTPVMLFIEGSKGSFAVRAFPAAGLPDTFLVQNKVFSSKALPGAKITVFNHTALLGHRGKYQIEVKTRKGIIKGTTDSATLKSYVWIHVPDNRDNPYINFEFKRNKYNASNPNVGSLISHKAKRG